MTAINDTIRRHYQADIGDQGALLARINAVLDGMSGPLNAAQLASIDQFHVGGLAATVEFARRLGIEADALVLDAGSGLGGPSRYLAETFGCRVEGIDLSPDYVEIAKLLTERAGLSAKVGHHVGDLTDLPFPNASFDLVWTQHVVMNIRDRATLYREIRRVLKPGGRFAFYDPIAADGHPEPFFPMPWAETPATSTLLTAAETKAVLEDAGLRVEALDDVSREALGWVGQQQEAGPPPVLSTDLVVGPRMGPMVANFGRNVKEGRVRLVMGICTAA